MRTRFEFIRDETEPFRVPVRLFAEVTITCLRADGSNATWDLEYLINPIWDANVELAELTESERERFGTEAQAYADASAQLAWQEYAEGDADWQAAQRDAEALADWDGDDPGTRDTE